MEGARQYAKLFKTGQYGKLYIVSGEHARGYTFRIQILPEGETAIPNGSGNECLNKNAVTVYDIISGQRGWTESYGWVHKGKWCDDFEALVSKRRKEIQEGNEKTKKLKEQSEQEHKSTIQNLLEKY